MVALLMFDPSPSLVLHKVWLKDQDLFFVLPMDAAASPGA